MLPWLVPVTPSKAFMSPIEDDDNGEKEEVEGGESQYDEIFPVYWEEILPCFYHWSHVTFLRCDDDTKFGDDVTGYRQTGAGVCI